MHACFFFAAQPDFSGDRTLRFFEYVTNESDSSRRHTDATHCSPRNHDLATDGTDRAGCVNRKSAA
jgi:hypothetical protein